MLGNEKIKYKGFGSIPHLPGSKTGPKDYTISKGQARIATEKTRDSKDLVIVQEKLDGTNVGVYKKNGELIPLTRNGYDTRGSKYLSHRLFSSYFEKNKERFNQLLNEGEIIRGEWLAVACGTRYCLTHEPFVAFDIFDSNSKRYPFEEFFKTVLKYYFVTPSLIHYGYIACPIQTALDKTRYSAHGAIDEVEGAVWRIERDGKVDFLCKYVRKSKITGYYVPEFNKNISSEVINENAMRFV